jgi:FKBP-type peptidyl-prolyl cis-trans isomerase FkpA
MKKQKQQRRSCPAIFESLENRQFLSASPAVSDATSFSTATTLTMSNRDATLGQTVVIKGVVSSSGGLDKGAVTELLDNGADTGLTSTVNHLGYTVFTLGPSQAIYVGSQEWRIRVLTDGNFVGSKSRQLTAKVVAPKLTTESDGLDLGSVTAGSGAAAAAGDSVTVTYTGFNAANGEEFDDSAAHSPGTFTFSLDANPEAVIPGFDQEVTGMQDGETRVAVIPEALAYQTGSGSSLAGDTLVFIVQLVSFTS